MLDTVRGGPAAGVEIELWSLKEGERTHLKTATTNPGGRTDEPLLGEEELRQGVYELVFHVGEYFAGGPAPVSEPPFLDLVPVRFAVADPDSHYHVPLLVSPWSYSTYRGS